MTDLSSTMTAWATLTNTYWWVGAGGEGGETCKECVAKQEEKWVKEVNK